MPREDVVATGPHSLKAQPSPGPDHVRGMQSLGPRGVRRGFTVKMDARHRQRGDQHSHTPVVILLGNFLGYSMII